MKEVALRCKSGTDVRVSEDILQNFPFVGQKKLYYSVFIICIDEPNVESFPAIIARMNQNIWTTEDILFKNSI